VDYRNKADLVDFGRKVLNLPTNDKIVLTSFVVDQGLMLPRDFGSKMLWMVIRLRAKIQKLDRAGLYCAVLSSSDHGISFAEETIRQTVEWMINGKDRDDYRSAGGFGAGELAQLEAAVNKLINRRTQK